MIIIFESVATGAELDRLTIDDDTGAVLDDGTGRGRAVVEAIVRRHGALAPAVLRSWSNGAVLTREVSDAAVSD